VPDPRLALDVAVLVFGIVGAYFTMRAQLADARREATEARRSSTAGHGRLDDHEKRLIGLERDTGYHAKRLEDSLAEIKAQLGALNAQVNARLDKLAERGVHCSHCHTEE
jgi:hypothetical protein